MPDPVGGDGAGQARGANLTVVIEGRSRLAGVPLCRNRTATASTPHASRADAIPAPAFQD